MNSNSNFNFENDFFNLFNKEKSFDARKNFNCRLCDLYSLYPDIFFKGFTSKDRAGIRYNPKKEEEAKEILSKYYIPDLLSSGKASIYLTQTKTGYTTKHIYIKKDTEKYQDLKESEDVKKILDSNLSLTDKSYEIHLLFPSYSSKQIYGLIYRNSI
jgi:hypothetical protein